MNETGHIESFVNPIGYIDSCFKHKNGTPRQPTICSMSKAKLTILKKVFNNPEHSLEGLSNFTHVWLIFLFHKNSNASTKAKVKPPRLNGQKTGIFSTRSPYRPNPIGLTLAKIEKISGSTVHLSGIDILDGTPVLDIKPYIPEYDSCPEPADIPKQDGEDDKALASHEAYELVGAESSEVNQLNSVSSSCVSDECEPSTSCDKTPASSSSLIETNEALVNTCDAGSTNNATIASWIVNPPINPLSVRFTSKALQNLTCFSQSAREDKYKLNFLKDGDEARVSIEDILKADPRSTYRRKKCEDKLYFFTLDSMHVTAWFDGNEAEVLRVQPISNSFTP